MASQMAILDSDVSLLSVEESDVPPLLFLFFFFVPLLDVVLRFLFFFFFFFFLVIVLIVLLLLLLLLIFLMTPLSPARRASVAANTTRPPEASPQSPRVTEEVGHDLVGLTHRDGIYVSDASVTPTRSTTKQTKRRMVVRIVMVVFLLLCRCVCCVVVMVVMFGILTFNKDCCAIHIGNMLDSFVGVFWARGSRCRILVNGLVGGRTDGRMEDHV